MNKRSAGYNITNDFDMNCAFINDVLKKHCPFILEGMSNWLIDTFSDVCYDICQVHTRTDWHIYKKERNKTGDKFSIDDLFKIMEYEHQDFLDYSEQIRQGGNIITNCEKITIDNFNITNAKEIKDFFSSFLIHIDCRFHALSKEQFDEFFADMYKYAQPISAKIYEK